MNFYDWVDKLSNPTRDDYSSFPPTALGISFSNALDVLSVWQMFGTADEKDASFSSADKCGDREEFNVVSSVYVVVWSAKSAKNRRSGRQNRQTNVGEFLVSVNVYVPVRGHTDPVKRLEDGDLPPGTRAKSHALPAPGRP